MFREIRYALLVTLVPVISGCEDDKSPILPTPEVRYEGVVYIGCDIGPYGFNMDSLITYCTSVIDDALPVDSQMVACTYDELAAVLSADFDVSMVRGDTLNTIVLGEVRGDPDISQVPLEIGGQMYAWGEYPYYSGYLLEWPQRSLRIQMANQWVGGCFHDLALWEVVIH
ncbi:MAG: hypothetical protein R3330_04630 [Saprospiraceae bacterium]|nr:hypothetical protein [Saprospiraceae bacterium]